MKRLILLLTVFNVGTIMVEKFSVESRVVQSVDVNSEEHISPNNADYHMYFTVFMTLASILVYSSEIKLINKKVKKLWRIN